MNSKKKVRGNWLIDDLMAFSIFLFPVLISNVVPVLVVRMWFLFALVLFYFIYFDNKFRYNKRLLLYSILYSILILIVGWNNGDYVIGTIPFIILWPFFWEKRIEFDPKISVILILGAYFFLSEKNPYTNRYWFFYEPNFSAILLICLQFILVKNKRILLFILSLSFIILLQSRTLILVDFILILSLLFTDRSKRIDQLLFKVINLKLFYILTFVFTIYSAVYMSNYISTESWSGGYRYGLQERIFGGIDDASNAERIMANVYTLEILTKKPTTLLTGMSFDKYSDKMDTEGTTIAHNYILSSIMNYGISSLFLFLMLYYILRKKHNLINKWLLMSWLLIATIVNASVISSYFGILVLLSLSINRNWEIEVENKS